MSLVELLVVMVFIGLIGTLMITTFSTTTNAYGQVDDETRGLSDLETVVERLGRDLRAARGIEAPADSTQLTIWIDGNSDYIRNAGEIYTWKIRCRLHPATCDPLLPNQYDVVRVNDLGAEQVIGYSLVSDIAFSYPDSPTTPSLSKRVRVSMEYNAIQEAYASDRTAAFEIRLRNA